MNRYFHTNQSTWKLWCLHFSWNIDGFRFTYIAKSGSMASQLYLVEINTLFLVVVVATSASCNPFISKRDKKNDVLLMTSWLVSHDCDIDDLNKILDSKFYTISRSDDVLTTYYSWVWVLICSVLCFCFEWTNNNWMAPREGRWDAGKKENKQIELFERA